MRNTTEPTLPTLSTPGRERARSRVEEEERRESYETLERLQQWNTAEFCDPTLALSGGEGMMPLPQGREHRSESVLEAGQIVSSQL